MNKIKNILILAGGDSTRLWPLRDKNLISFLGKSLILHQLENLSDYGDKITIVSNKNNKDKFTELVNQSKKSNWQIVEQNENLTGQIGAVLSARNKINGEVLIVGANDFFNPSVLHQLIEKSKTKKSPILLTKRIKDYFPGGYLKFENGEIVAIIEKPGKENAPSDIVKLVVDYFADFNELADVLENVRENPEGGYEEGLSLLIAKTKKADYVLYEDQWQTLKYPWHVLPMMSFFLKKLTKDMIKKGVFISKHATIKGPVFLGENVKIGDYAKIVGPIYIGDNSVVGDYSLVRESNIGNNCLVGGFSEVTRSYLSDGVMLHRNYVGDSIIGKNVLMGAGAVTANFRFDQSEVKSEVGGERINTNLTKMGAIIGPETKIGVNSTIFPGVKIGSRSLIAPGSIIDEDVDDNIFVFKSGKKINKDI